MTAKQWLFSFQGRIGRKRFWMWNIIYYLILFAASLAAQALGQGGMVYLLTLLVPLLLLWPDMAVLAKRWHDRNKSTWWILLTVPVRLGQVVVPAGAMAQSPDLMTTMISLAALICGGWILVECGFLRGTGGPNKYGDHADL